MKVRGIDLKFCRSCWLRAGWLTVLVSTAAAAQPSLVLPAPSQNPQSIDFASDPLIAFVRAEAPAEAFRTAVGEAVARHPSVGEAEAGTAEARARRTEVRSALFPRFDGQLVAARSIARDFGARTAIVESLQPSSRADSTLSGDQLLFDFGAVGGRIASANANVRAARADSERVATATALRAVTSWYNVLLYQMLGDLSDAAVARLRSIAGDMRTRQSSGMGTGGDVARSDAGLADAIGRAARVERLLADARAQYREVFGNPPPPRLTRPTPPFSQATTVETAQTLSHTTPAAVTAKARVDATRADARAARADRLPRISAGVSGTLYDTFDKAQDYDVRGQIVLRQTLSTGGAERARADQAKARARAAQYADERTVGEAERDAASALADSQILDRSLASLEDAYRANRRARDVTVEQFRVSRGSLLDVLRVEDDFVSSASSYLQGAVERDLARYTLLSRTGEILPLFGVTVTDGSQ